jgi:lincosamide nucleotidyltransferase A/C/D/E
MMTGTDLLDVLDVMARAQAGEARLWLAGGWGIDALIKEQTRPHRDVDLVHDRAQEPTMLGALAAAGFEEVLDLRPVRFVMRDGAGRELDLHPLVFAADGSAVQAADSDGGTFRYPAACFTTGTVLGRRVPCISVSQQVRFHQGYEPADRDRHDMAQLRRVFGVATHF